MKHLTSAIVLASVFTFQSSPAPAQTRPDFSGNWVMDPARSQSAVQDEPIRSMTMVITQTAIDLMRSDDAGARR